MLATFIKKIREENWHDKKIIVAISGGADSMALATLLHQAKVNIILAHCNFGLRAKESDDDETYVTDWAKANQISYFVKRFALKNSPELTENNIQILARKLRYDWFEQLRSEENFDLIATAHHKQDSVETLLYNFLKGTGIAGLHGILQQNGKIIRPLLQFSKEEIIHFCETNNIAWREDSSNKKDTYTRNRIRHHLIPLLNEIVPSATDNLFKNTQRFSEVEMLYNQRLEQLRKKLIEKRNKDWYIPIRKIKNYQPLYTILFELLKPFQFSAASINDVIQLISSESGKQVISQSHRIIRDRNFLIITALSTEESTHIQIDISKKKKQKIDFGENNIEISHTDVSSYLATSSKEAFINLEKLEPPIILRPRKTGDYFYPFGMGMKKKKVSRFLIDQKIPIHEKEKVWVLESNKRIVWIVGMRIDERFKLNQTDKKALYFKIM